MSSLESGKELQSNQNRTEWWEHKQLNTSIIFLSWSGNGNSCTVFELHLIHCNNNIIATTATIALLFTPEIETTSLLTMFHLCCLLFAPLCDSTYRSGNFFPETAFVMSCFMSVLELGSKVDTYVSYFLYAAHFWRATLSVFISLDSLM